MRPDSFLICVVVLVFAAFAVGYGLGVGTARLMLPARLMLRKKRGLEAGKQRELYLTR